MLELHLMKGSTVLSLVIIAMVLFEEVPGAVVVVVAGRRETAQKPDAPAMFVFGDEMMDVGNNNYFQLGDAERADHPYYGIDFPFPNANQSTGRFSNGRNMADFVAMSMGFNMSPPAYMSLTSPIKIVEGFSGVNYASAGAGIWNMTAGIFADEAAIALLQQVDNFANTIRQIQDSTKQQRRLAKLISKSFFLIGIGANDIRLNAFVRNKKLANLTSPENLAPMYEAAIISLYGMGARKFGIINLPPFGCTPPSTTRCGGLDTTARRFNDVLKVLLSDMAKNSSLHGLRYSIADFYAFANATFMNPSAYGFVKDIYSPCCPEPCSPIRYGPYETITPPCDDRTHYWFWDGENPTEQAVKLSAAAFYDGKPKFTSPISFKKLIHQE